MTAAHRNTYFMMLLYVAGGAFLWATQFAVSAGAADGPQRDARPPASATATVKKHSDAGQIETAPTKADPSRTINLYGTVFGPESRPIAGARLFLNVDEWTNTIELGTSNDDGSYRFEISEKKLRRVVAPSFMLLKQKASLIAVADGFGPAWAELPSVTGARLGEMQHQYDCDFHLVADLPIAGQVVLEGKPVAGAVVAVSRIYDLSDPDWYKMHRAIRSNDPDLMSRKEIDPTGWFTPLYRTAWKVIPPATTDAEGRFRIAGVGRDRAINLRVEGPGIRNTDVSVLTRHDAADFTRAVRAKYPRTPDLDGYFYPSRKDESKGEPGVPLFGPSPTIQVDPARTISGVVRDAETREPIVDVRVRVHAVVSSAQATTDRQGRYHIQRSEDKHSLLVYTQSAPERYLDVVHRLTDAQGLGGEIDADLELPRGVVVTGRVLEAGTDRPIVSAPDGSCHVQWPGPLQTGYVQYFPLASNTALRGSPTGLYFEGIQPGKANYFTSVEIDPDGGFRIAVPPGPGVLLVRSSPGMPFNAELIARWEESQGFHRLFPYVALESRTGDDGAPGENLHSFPGFAGPIPLTGHRRYHGYRVINPPADAESLDLTITVPRGETRTIRFVKPDGRPIRRVKVHGLVALPQNMTIEVDDSDAEVFALEPGKPRQITATSDDGKYAGRTFISTDDPQLRTITLEPTASISGRLLDLSTGEPLAGYSMSVINSEALPWSGIGATELVKTDADGRFLALGLHPHRAASIKFQEPAPKKFFIGSLRHYQPESLQNLVLDAGEVRDLGDIRIKTSVADE